MNKYRINESFYSLQGEGIRAGTPNIFLRFTGCNMRCDMEANNKSPGGFMCDTEFESGIWMTLQDILDTFQRLAPACKNVILTGGEPCLQIDDALIGRLKNAGYYLAVETNGSLQVPPGIDWITVSPKVAEHCIKQLKAHELKYVRHAGQGIPRPTCTAHHYLLSPAADENGIQPASLGWCIKLVKENPQWRLSCQLHKQWAIR